MNPGDVLDHLPVTALAWTAVTTAAGLTARTAWLVWVTRRHSGGGHLVHIQAPPEVDPRGAARLWANLAGLGQRRWKRRWKGQSHVVWEYAWRGNELDIRVWTPDALRAAFVQRAVAAAWPGAVCEITPSDEPLPQGGIVTTGAVAFGADADPINADLATDPLRGLLSAASGDARSQSAIVQVYARPASRPRIQKLRQVMLGTRPASVASVLLDIIDPSSEKSRTHKPANMDRKGLERARGPMFEMVVRYAATETNRQDPERARRAARSRAGRLAGAMSVFCGPAGITRQRWVAARMIRNRMLRHGAGKLLSTDEIAALAHLPADDALPQVDRAGAQCVAPVAAIASGGRNFKVLGTSAATGRKVAISAADARHHMYVVGVTGTGKSTLLTHLVLDDIRQRRGVVVIEPKGDLINDIVDRLDPADVADRLWIIDPDQERHVGINPLAGDDLDLVTDHFVSICRNIWPSHWGPRADDILRSAVLTLMESRRPVLDALPTLLTNKHERSKITAKMTGPLGGFWEWYDTLPGGVQAQAMGPVLSRIRAQMTRSFVRDTIGNPTADINMNKILDGGILLVRLPKGQIGDDSARLLGSVVVARVWQAATARAARPEHARRDASLYLDEAQNFLALPRDLGDVLAEARGYRLSLVLAHQHLAQMPKDLYAAIAANARSKIVFQVSPDDAKVLAKQTSPHLTDHDLAHLEPFTAACCVFSNGKQQPAFTLATLPHRGAVGQAPAVRAAATPSAEVAGETTPAPTPRARARSGPKSGALAETSTPTSPRQPVTPQLARHDGSSP